jgi:hypothetical protein
MNKRLSILFCISVVGETFSFFSVSYNIRQKSFIYSDNVGSALKIINFKELTQI